jgi:hypothetical protein
MGAGFLCALHFLASMCGHQGLNRGLLDFIAASWVLLHPDCAAHCWLQLAPPGGLLHTRQHPRPLHSQLCMTYVCCIFLDRNNTLTWRLAVVEVTHRSVQGYTRPAQGPHLTHPAAPFLTQLSRQGCLMESHTPRNPKLELHWPFTGSIGWEGVLSARFPPETRSRQAAEGAGGTPGVDGGLCRGRVCQPQASGQQARANGVAMRCTKDRAGLKLRGCCILAGVWGAQAACAAVCCAHEPLLGPC